jgi:tetratricopeptide (TPR) repeat protein
MMKKLIIYITLIINIYADTNSTINSDKLSVTMGYINSGDYRGCIDTLNTIDVNQNIYNKFDVNYLYGYCLNMMGEYSSAIGYLERAKKLQPSNRQIYATLGYSYIAQNRLDMANTLFSEYLKVEKNSYEANYLKGFVLYHIANYKEATYYLKRAIKLKPNYAEALAYLGLCSGKLNAHSDSAYLLQESMKANKDSASQILKDALYSLTDTEDIQTVALRGAVYYGLKEYDNALDNYLRLYGINKNDKFLNSIIAQIYLEKGIYITAIEYLQNSINSGATNPHTYYLLAKSYLNIEKYTQAIKNIKIAIDKDASKATYHLLLAKAYEGDRQNLNAIAQYKKALLLDDTLTLAQKKIAINQIETKEYNDALINLLKLYKTDPKDKEIVYNLGLVYLLLNNYKEAIGYFDIAKNIDKNTKVFNYYYYSGYCYYALNMYQEALVELKEALKIVPNDKETLYYMSLAYASTHKLDKMAENLKKILNQDSTHLGANYMLGSYYYKNGLYKKAVPLLKYVVDNGEENKQRASDMLQDAIKSIN